MIHKICEHHCLLDEDIQVIEMFGVIKYELLMVLLSLSLLFHFLSEYDEGIEDIFKMYILGKAK